MVLTGMEVVEVVVDSTGTVVVVVEVVVVPNRGRVIACKGALLGQYRDGYPS